MVALKEQPVLPELLEGLNFGKSALTFKQLLNPFLRPLSVLYNGVFQSIWVMDPGTRPPDEGGVWFDDLVSEACRQIFGCTRGSARPITGQPAGNQQLEFREVWPDPLIGKVVERVKLKVENQYGNEYREISCVVSCRAVPGADLESVIRAELYAICRRNLGPGILRQPSASHWTWQERPELHEDVAPAAPEYVCRFTVHRFGHPHEVMITLPPSFGGDWAVTQRKITDVCKVRFGSGRLIYCPESSETSFDWR